MTVWVDVGGYRLAADVVAGGEPPIVFISGLGDGRDVWAQFLPLLRGGTTTITFDRAGIGESEPQILRTPRPYSALADEIVALLNGLPVTGPFVVVAHSLGAVIARSFAARHPALVAGVVLIDGSVDEVALWSGTPTRDGDRPDATLLDYRAGAAELATARHPAVPVAVVTRTPGRSWPIPESVGKSTEEIDRRWTGHQREMADRLDAVLLVANDSGHYVYHAAAALVALAVDAVTGAVVAGDGVIKLDGAQVAAAGGRLARVQLNQDSRFGFASG